MKSKLSQSRLDSVILFIALVLANLRATIFVFLHPDVSTLVGPAWIEIALWTLLAGMSMHSLARSGEIKEFLAIWRRNWLPALFILLAFLSTLWSMGPLTTWFSSLELFLAALVASYLGRRTTPEKIMDALFWFGALLFILSIALVIGAPPTGTMYWAPFDGAWRGVYWHRNHLASVAAFLSIVYLCRMFLALRSRNPRGILDTILYSLALVILYFARSATGYIVFMVLHGAGFVAWAWLRVERRLRRGHYILILVGSVLAVAFLLDNLDFVFGLLGRDTSMTGRVGLWKNLIHLASRHPWLGHGFGAVWTLDSFREEIRQLARWPSQPLIADNGFLDIYLHLGLVGVLIFLGVFILSTLRSLGYGVRQKTLTAFFPLLVMIYALVGNLAFSLFAETEVLVWFLIIVSLFMSTSPSETSIIS